MVHRSPPMTLSRAVIRRADMLMEAGKLAAQASNRKLPWHARYKAAIALDDCLECANEYDELARDLVPKALHR